MKIGIFILAIFFMMSLSSMAQTAHQSLRSGDAAYAKKDYKKSEEHYRRALESERSSKATYNLGNAIYDQKRYDEAIQQYEDAEKKTSDNQLKFNSLYNKGNAQFWKKDYAKAVESYKNALRLNPQDEDAKKNLALAQRFKKKEEEEQKKQQQQQQNKDNKEDKNKNDKDKQPQNQDDKDPNQDKNQDKNQQDKNQKQPNQPDQNPNQSPQEKAQQDLKKEEAKRMLQIMDDEERKVQQRLKKGSPRPSRSTKDW